ncbi:protein of unknown function [Pseudorhizobium banfieldiae]|uniref:Uncharacterized protein n=1 Tax=Pseudorhizobium banfieldiae TaxID=1125847 RepID=L0NI79_9HYPH|nr:protein of unknown function [Pseudorhizobium banfieldiae]
MAEWASLVPMETEVPWLRHLIIAAVGLKPKYLLAIVHVF